MNGLERITDALRWLGEVEANASAPKPPAKALGLVDGAPTLLRRSGDDYAPDRPARPGDNAPLFLAGDQVLTIDVTTPAEAAVFGASAARIEAAKACPFPLEEGASALSPAPDSWGEDGAQWTLAALPKNRLDALRTEIAASGARPDPAFTLSGGAPMHLERRPRRSGLLACFALAIVSAGVAIASVLTGASQIESAAEARLTAARTALTAAETEAAAALAAREAAAGPLEQAQIAGAALARAPSAAATLAALAAAAPDDAYVRRVSIRPTTVSGEFIAPDAAALAAEIAAHPDFAAARLDGPAMADGGALQRARLTITPRPPE